MYERDVLAQKKSAEVGARGDALYEQTSKTRHNEESGKGRNEGREREEEHEEEENDTFLKLSFCREALFISYFA